MKRFKEVKIGETFYTSNGRPSRKVSDGTAISLVPILTGFDFQMAIEDYEFSYDGEKHVYGIGKAKGFRL